VALSQGGSAGVRPAIKPDGGIVAPRPLRQGIAMTQRRLSDPPALSALSSADIDGLGRAVLTLARELWVVIDRQAVTEAILAEAGIPVARIDGFVRDAPFEAGLERRRDALVAALFAAMAGSGE
jgi:hypothetical protein